MPEDETRTLKEMIEGFASDLEVSTWASGVIIVGYDKFKTCHIEFFARLVFRPVSTFGAYRDVCDGNGYTEFRFNGFECGFYCKQFVNILFADEVALNLAAYIVIKSVRFLDIFR